MSSEQAISAARDAPPTDRPVVELRNVCKYYESVHAIDGVDFQIFPNEIHALVGDNGAGKSTLIKLISGAHRPTSGEVWVDGRPVELNSPKDAFGFGIATLYQDLALVDVRDIASNIFLGREPVKWGFLIDRKMMLQESRRLVERLGQVNVSDVLAEVGNLSGGQRQAVAIGRIVHRGGRVLVLDEPTAALGVRESHEILNLIESLKTNGRAVVIVSHNLAHVFRISDRITVLRKGKRVGTRVKANTDPDEIVKMITGADLL